jgi:hypothetical protein
VAISLCGKADRLNPARAPESRDRVQRNASAAYLEKLYRVLPPFQDAFIANKGCAYAESEVRASGESPNSGNPDSGPWHDKTARPGKELAE